nr:ORF73 [Acipenserid herpesvirus 1]
MANHDLSTDYAEINDYRQISTPLIFDTVSSFASPVFSFNNNNITDNNNAAFVNPNDAHPFSDAATAAIAAVDTVATVAAIAAVEDNRQTFRFMPTIREEPSIPTETRSVNFTSPLVNDISNITTRAHSIAATDSNRAAEISQPIDVNTELPSRAASTVTAAANNLSIIDTLKTHYNASNSGLKNYIQHLSGDAFFNFYDYVEAQPPSSFKNRVVRWLRKKSIELNAHMLSVTVSQNKACVNNFNNICNQVGNIKGSIRNAIDVLKKGVSENYVNNTNDILDELKSIIDNLIANVDFKKLSKINNTLDKAVEELTINNTELLLCVTSLKRLIENIYRLREVHVFSAKDFIDTAVNQISAPPNVDLDLATIAQKVSSQTIQDEVFLTSLINQLSKHSTNRDQQITEINYTLINDVHMDNANANVNTNANETNRRYQHLFVDAQDVIMETTQETVVVPVVTKVDTGLTNLDKGLTVTRQTTATVKEYVIQCLTILQNVSDHIADYTNHNVNQLRTAFVKAFEGYEVTNILFRDQNPSNVVSTIATYIHSLQKKIAEISKMYQMHINNMAQTTQSLLTEYNTANVQLQTLHQNVDLVANQSTQNTQQLQQANLDLTNQLTTSATTVNALEQIMAGNEHLNQSLNEQNVQLVNNINALNAELAQARQEKVELERMMEELKTSANEQFQQVVESSSEQVAQAAALVTTIENECLNKVADTHTERANVINNLKLTEDQLKICQTNITKLEDEKATNEITIAQLSARVLQLETIHTTNDMVMAQTHTDHKTQTEKYDQQIEDYRNAIQGLMNTNSETTKDIYTLTEQHNKLQQVYNESVKEIEDLKRTYDKTQADLKQQLRIELANKDDDIEGLNEQLKQNYKKNERLEKNIRDLKIELENNEVVNTNLVDLQLRHAEVVNQLSNLNNQYKSITQANETLAIEKTLLEDKLMEYQCEKALIVDQHDKLINQTIDSYDQKIIDLNNKLNEANATIEQQQQIVIQAQRIRIPPPAPIPTLEPAPIPALVPPRAPLRAHPSQNRRHTLIASVSLKRKAQQVKKLTTEIISLKRQLKANTTQIRKGNNQLQLTKRCIEYVIQCHVNNNDVMEAHIVQLNQLLAQNPDNPALKMCLTFIQNQQQTFSGLVALIRSQMEEQDDPPENEDDNMDNNNNNNNSDDEDDDDDDDEDDDGNQNIADLTQAPAQTLAQAPAQAPNFSFLDTARAPTPAFRFFDAADQEAPFFFPDNLPRVPTPAPPTPAPHTVRMIDAATAIKIKQEVIDQYNQFQCRPVIITNWYHQLTEKQCLMTQFTPDNIDKFIGPQRAVLENMPNDPPFYKLTMLHLTFCNQWNNYEYFPQAVYYNPLEYIDQTQAAHTYPNVYIITDEASLNELKTIVNKTVLLSFFYFAFITDKGLWVYYPMYNLYLAPVPNLHPCKELIDVFTQHQLDPMCIITHMMPEIYIPFLVCKRFESHPIYFSNYQYQAKASHLLKSHMIPIPDTSIMWYKIQDHIKQEDEEEEEKEEDEDL